MRKKLGIAALIVVGLIVAAGLILPHVIDINKYHDQIQSQLQTKLGRPVSLGKMSLSVFPPSFAVTNASVGDDAGFRAGQVFASTRKLSVSVKFWPLLRKEVAIQSLELDRPQIELVRNARGVWNFASIGESKPSPTGKTPASGDIGLSNLVISDGQVAITDQLNRQPRAVYDHIDLEVSDFAPNQEFSLKLAAHLPGQGKQTISLEGKGGPVQASDPMKTNFNGELHLEQVSISGVEKFAGTSALTGIEAQVSGDAKVKNASGKVTSSGSIRMEDPRIHDVNVGYPITLDYDLSDDLSNDLLQIRKGVVKLGSTPLSVAGSINSKNTPAVVDLKITASDASIGEAARLASAFGVAFGKGMDVNGKINADLQARGPISNPALNGKISARELAVSGKELPQSVKVDSIDLALTPDTIRSNDFSFKAGSTSVAMNFALSQYTTNNSNITASLRAPNAKLGEILSIAKAYGVSAVEGMSGDGQLSLDVHVQGPTKNPDQLAFSGSGKLQNATLKVPQLTKPIQFKNCDLKFSQNSATLDNFSAQLGQTNASGSMTLKNFAAPQVQFALNADKINVDELQQMYVAVPAKRAENSDGWQIVPQVWAATQSDANFLNQMTGSGTASIGTLQYGDLLLSNVRSNTNLDHGLIKMNPVTADVYGGKTAGNITMDMRPAQPVYSINLKSEKVDANKLVSAVSSMKQMLYGALNSNVNATFSSTSADSIARGLNGDIALDLSNGKLVGLDLLKELSTVGKFVGGVAPPKGFTNIAALSGNFVVKDGVAQTNNLKAAIDGGTMSGAGIINLADQSLNMHITAILTKAMSQQVGGTQVGGFMNTALANNQGELVMPILLTGTFKRPIVAPDIQQIAQMKLQNLLPTSKGGGLMDLLGGKKQPGDTTQKTGAQQQSPQDQVTDALGGLFGKKKKPADQKQNPPPK